MTAGTRVALLDPGAWSPGYGAALAEAVAASGCEVDLLTAPAPGAWNAARGYRRHELFFAAPKRPGAPKLHRRLLRGLGYPIGWRRALGELRRRRPHVIHQIWLPLPALDRRLLARASAATGARLVLTEHNGGLRADARAGLPARGRALARADAVVTLSQAVADDLARRGVVARERLRVIPCGVGERPPLERGAARRELGLDPEAPVVLFTGLIRPYKGLGTLLAAFERVVRARPEARLVLAGLPRVVWAPWTAALRERGLAGVTHLDLDDLPAARVDLHLAAADLVALPYLEGAQSAVLAAALGAERLPVATAVGGLPEQLGSEGAHLLVPPGDGEALATKLLAWLEDRERTDALAVQLAAQARSRCGWKRVGEATAALYRELTRRAERRETG